MDIFIDDSTAPGEVNKNGIKWFIDRIRKEGHRAILYSTKKDDPEAMKNIMAELKTNGLHFDGVWKTAKPEGIIIDKSCIRFKSKFQQVYDIMKNMNKEKETSK